MESPEFIWVHLNHACDEIDVWRVTQPEEARIAKGQGYIPLTTLRQLKAENKAFREWLGEDGLIEMAVVHEVDVLLSEKP